MNNRRYGKRKQQHQQRPGKNGCITPPSTPQALSPTESKRKQQRSRNGLQSIKGKLQLIAQEREKQRLSKSKFSWQKNNASSIKEVDTAPQSRWKKQKKNNNKNKNNNRHNNNNKLKNSINSNESSAACSESPNQKNYVPKSNTFSNKKDRRKGRKQQFLESFVRVFVVFICARMNADWSTFFVCCGFVNICNKL